MRVSLQIEGDAKGAVQAATDTSKAVETLGDKADEAGKHLKDTLEQSGGVANRTRDTSGKLAAANDNVSGTAIEAAKSFGQLSDKLLGADSAFSKVVNTSGTLASGFTNLVRGGAGLAAIPGAIGLGITAVSLFYSIANSGSDSAAKRLEEQARLIGIVRDAYNQAGAAAGKFVSQSANVTRFQQQQNLLGLQQDLQRQTQALVSGANRNRFFAGVNTYATPDLQASTLQNYDKLMVAVDALNARIAAGSPDLQKYQDQIEAIGKAAAKTDPALAKIASQFLDQTKTAAKTADAIKDAEANLAQLNGTANKEQRDRLGIQDNDFDRMVKSLQRQTAAQQAEADAVGLSAGAAAKLRAQYLLNEAATQAGIKVTGQYADTVDKLASKFGAAAQKAAEAQVKSNAAFDLGQLGRTQPEQAVASQLRAAYGDDVEKQMNGALAASLRFNQALQDIKSTTVDLSQGAWRDFRQQIQAGASAWQALGTAGVNALNKIIDKLADKSIDTFVSAIVGGGSGGSGLIGSLGKFFGGAATGGTFGPGWGLVGEKGPELIKVHAGGGVTVYPNEITKQYLPGFAIGGSLSANGSISRSLPAAAPVPSVVMGDTYVTVQGNADQTTLALMRQEFAKRDAAQYRNVVDAVQKARDRNELK